MSQWEQVDSDWEAKVTNKGEILMRQAGQRDEYPHVTLKYDSRGNLVDYHWSDSRFGNRFGQNEVVATALAFLRGKGML